MSWNNILLIFRKELLDITRDKRTVISMIVIPLLGFPLLILGMSAFMIKQVEKLETQNYTVLVVGTNSAPEFFNKLQGNNDITWQKFDRRGDLTDPQDVEQAKMLLKEGSVHGVMILPDSGFEDRDQTARISLLLDQSKESGSVVHGKISETLRTIREEMSQERIKEYNDRIV